MFLSLYNFFKCIIIIILFIFLPKYFLRILVGNKILKCKNFFLDTNIQNNFEVINETIKFDEINIICRGKSLMDYKKYINFEIPTFFINFYDIGTNNIYNIQEKDNFFGITTDFNVKQKMKSTFKKTILILNGYNKNGKIEYYFKDGIYQSDVDLLNDAKISEESKNLFNNLNHSKLLIKFHNDKEHLDIGSALCILAFFEKISNKVNVYGYDHYLSSEICDMSYVKLFFSIFNETTKRNPKPVEKSSIKSLINYFFIYHFESTKKINMYCFLKNLKKKKFLINQLNKVFFNPK